MKFKEFLEGFAKRKNFTNSVELYNYFGGAKALKISKDLFQKLFHGQLKPSIKLVDNLFPLLDDFDRKNLLISYFNGTLNSSNYELIKSMLMNTPAFSVPKNSLAIWEKKPAKKFLSESQLEYLISSPEAARVFNKLLIYDRIDNTDFSFKKKILDDLVELDLAVRHKNHYSIPAQIMMLPNWENSTKPAVKKANQYILSHTYNYLDNDPNKENISYVIQRVKKKDFEYIKEQKTLFKRWIQSMAYDDTSEESVPFLYISYTRIIDKNEF